MDSTQKELVEEVRSEEKKAPYTFKKKAHENRMMLVYEHVRFSIQLISAGFEQSHVAQIDVWPTVKACCSWTRLQSGCLNQLEVSRAERVTFQGAYKSQTQLMNGFRSYRIQ